MFFIDALPTDQLTDRPTNQPTDTAYYSDVRTHLKIKSLSDSNSYWSTESYDTNKRTHWESPRQGRRGKLENCIKNHSTHSYSREKKSQYNWICIYQFLSWNEKVFENRSQWHYTGPKSNLEEKWLFTENRIEERIWNLTFADTIEISGVHDQN